MLWRLDSISWRKTLEIEQNSIQWLVVKTPFREKVSTSQPMGWIQGKTKIGSVLEVTASYLHGKHGVEIRIMSMKEDNTLSWVRIIHGSNEFVKDLNNNDTEIFEDQLEEQALQQDAKDFVDWSKARAKSQKRELADYSSGIIPMNTKNWIDIEQEKHSFSEYEVSKKVINILRLSQKVHRGYDGAKKSSASIPRIYSLIWCSMGSMFDSKRKS